MTNLIYKIVDVDTWQKAETDGEFAGATIDLTDGYIHFSSPEQVQETADKYFTNQTDLLLVAVDADSLGDALRWEASRSGAMFPHLYGNLALDHVVSATPVRQDKNGRHLLDSLS